MTRVIGIYCLWSSKNSLQIFVFPFLDATLGLYCRGPWQVSYFRSDSEIHLGGVVGLCHAHLCVFTRAVCRELFCHISLICACLLHYTILESPWTASPVLEILWNFIILLWKRCLKPRNFSLHLGSKLKNKGNNQKSENMQTVSMTYCNSQYVILMSGKRLH